MKIINLLLLIAVFIFGVIQMRKSSSIIKTDWFKSLSYNEKLETTSKIKSNWKTSIILLAIIVCAMLILISSFIGKTHYYENTINILILIVGVIVTIFLVINNQKLEKNIKN
ncbi:MULTISPECIES: hypothetical protein [Clostridia]|uniref:DUF3784 domain-containing protein n=1 Tax=Clostridium saudiense TaxID=1414720 RepID=A0ABS2FKJ7_9CLOT|nr:MULTISPECIES: hypothetical protein [Clostridiaceae]MBM6820821.1 hypothetical protein [Clostridium saudiense]